MLNELYVTSVCFLSFHLRSLQAGPTTPINTSQSTSSREVREITQAPTSSLLDKMIITRALQGMLLRQEVLEVTEGIKTEERLRKMTPSNTVQAPSTQTPFPRRISTSTMTTSATMVLLFAYDQSFRCYRCPFFFIRKSSQS